MHAGAFVAPPAGVGVVSQTRRFPKLGHPRGVARQHSATTTENERNGEALKRSIKEFAEPAGADRRCASAACIKPRDRHVSWSWLAAELHYVSYCPAFRYRDVLPLIQAEPTLGCPGNADPTTVLYGNVRNGGEYYYYLESE